MNLASHTAQHIVEQLSKEFDGKIWVVNQANQVLACTEAVESKTKRSTAQSKPLTVPSTAQECVNLPLCVGDEEVGRLIIANSTPQSKEIAHVARAVAHLIIHQHRVFEQMFDRQWALDKFVSDLLHDRFAANPAAAFENALILNIDLEVPRIAVVIDLQPQPMYPSISTSSVQNGVAATAKNHKPEQRHTLDLAQRLLGKRSTHIFSFFDQHSLIILAAIEPRRIEAGRQRLKSISQRLIDELSQGSQSNLSAGIGAYHAGWQALSSSYQDARFALETGRTLLGAGHAFTTFDLGLAGFVCAHNDLTKSQLADHLLCQLLDKPELLQTLETYLDAELSAGAAAQQLNMHRHGLAYRLKKIHELTGLDPSNFHDAAQLAAALQWQRVAHEALFRP
ncbi:MAG: helix-turn-helix domain-containing protein [Caldilineaceae bacterium]